MTTTRIDHSLSRVELVILARMSCASPPSKKVLAEAVSDLLLPDHSSAYADDAVSHALGSLRRRSLVNDRKQTATEEGNRALRAAFDLQRTPTWTEVRTTHLAARALGLRPGTEQAEKTMKNASTIAIAVLRDHFKLPESTKLAAICDALIAQAVGLPPGPITIQRIRAHVLAKYSGGESSDTSTKLATQLAAKKLEAVAADKRSLTRALGHRWLYEALPAGEVRTSTTPRSAGIQPSLPLLNGEPAQPSTSRPQATTSTSASNGQPQTQSARTNGQTKTATSAAAEGLSKPLGSTAMTNQASVVATSADALLSVVRETIPRIGADGRFGAEKVFVSALWQRIERDGRIPDYSFDRFKHWLVTANRDQLLTLARADLVGAMDPTLVAESEIRHLGTSFHFVVDRRVATSGMERGIRAR